MPEDMIVKMAQDISGIKATLQTMANTNELAIKAFESAQSAHHRLDKMEKDVDVLEKNQNWLPKLVTSCAITAVITGAIAFIITKTLGG